MLSVPEGRIRFRRGPPAPPPLPTPCSSPLPQFLGFFYPYDQPIDLYDWSQITDVAWVPPTRTDVICAAHTAGRYGNLRTRYGTFTVRWCERRQQLSDGHARLHAFPFFFASARVSRSRG
jgi:hypothetical protein